MSTTPAANFATSFAGVVDTGGKFATGVNDIPAANLPPVSLVLLIPVANNRTNYQTADNLK